jgi:mRNA interferase HigB
VALASIWGHCGLAWHLAQGHALRRDTLKTPLGVFSLRYRLHSTVPRTVEALHGLETPGVVRQDLVGLSEHGCPFVVGTGYARVLGWWVGQRVIATRNGIEGSPYCVLDFIPKWDYNQGVHLVSLPPLLRFIGDHPDTKQAVLAWCSEVRKAEWKQPADIKAQYASASILKHRRVVFNLKGNDYRVVVAVAYQVGFVYVKFVGTHAQYDAIDANTVEQF